MSSVLFFFLKAQRVLSVSLNESWVETFSLQDSPMMGGKGVQIWPGLWTVRNCKARGGLAEGEADPPVKGPGLVLHSHHVTEKCGEVRSIVEERDWKWGPSV